MCFRSVCVCVCFTGLPLFRLTDLFIQQCHFLRQCGHSEKAVSLFQAMMDFTFFKPDSVRGLSTRQQVATPTLTSFTVMKWCRTL